MPITTYISEYEKRELLTCGDQDIDQLLHEVREKTGDGWYIQAIKGYTRRWFRKPLVNLFYTLYYAYEPGSTEVQVINFCLDHEWSINTNVSKAHMVNYLQGYVCGLGHRERRR